MMQRTKERLTGHNKPAPIFDEFEDRKPFTEASPVLPMTFFKIHGASDPATALHVRFRSARAMIAMHLTWKFSRFIHKRLIVQNDFRPIKLVSHPRERAQQSFARHNLRSVHRRVFRVLQNRAA